MELKALAVHVEEQELRIKRAISNNRFADLANSEAWAKFRNEVWGNQLVLESQKPVDMNIPDVDEDVDVERDGRTDKPATFMEIPRSLPSVWGGSQSTHVFVRSEYEEAEQAVLQANEIKRQTFLIGGQAGIGKTFFLIWLLVRRLALRLPTVLQISPNEAILFHEGGTSTFKELINGVFYEELGSKDHRRRIWVLVDSSPFLEQPTGVFCWGNPFFVVEAACSHRFEWAKKFMPKYFYMKTWTLSEVLQARSYMGLQDESIVRDLFETYSLPPRDLIDYAGRPGELPEYIDRLVKTIQPDKLRNLLLSPNSNKHSDLIILIEPSANHTSYMERFASHFAFQKLWDRHLQYQLSESAYFYDIFCDGGPATAASAGWMFESRMHQLLVQGYDMTLFPIARVATRAEDVDLFSNYTNTRDRRNERKLWFPASKTETLRKRMELKVDCYYRPEGRNFPTIDSLLLVRSVDGSHTLFMFQITRNRDKHDVKESGLDEVDRLELPRGTRKYYVVVSPSDRWPKIMAPKGRFVDGENRYVHVFHHPVVPATLFPLKHPK